MIMVLPSVTLYNWKNDLLGSEREWIMNNKIETSTNDEINKWKRKIEARNRKIKKRSISFTTCNNPVIAKYA